MGSGSSGPGSPQRGEAADLDFGLTEQPAGDLQGPSGGEVGLRPGAETSTKVAHGQAIKMGRRRIQAIHQFADNGVKSRTEQSALKMGVADSDCACPMMNGPQQALRLDRCFVRNPMSGTNRPRRMT